MFREKITKICIDFDGVVINSNFNFAMQFVTIGKNLTGTEITIEDVYSQWGHKISELLRIFFPKIDINAYAEERERLGYHMEENTTIPGALNAIEVISANLPISILTNRESCTLNQIINDIKIDCNLFEKIQSSDDTPYAKPDPRVFDDFLVRYEAKKFLYIGDHIIDYEAAKGAGVHFIGVTSGGITTRDDFIAAGVPENKILNSLADLPDFLGF